jgi:hypothetical protein
LDLLPGSCNPLRDMLLCRFGTIGMLNHAGQALLPQVLFKGSVQPFYPLPLVQVCTQLEKNLPRHQAVAKHWHCCVACAQKSCWVHSVVLGCHIRLHYSLHPYLECLPIHPSILPVASVHLTQCKHFLPTVLMDSTTPNSLQYNEGREFGPSLSCCICCLHLHIWTGCTHHFQEVGLTMWENASSTVFFFFF